MAIVIKKKVSLDFLGDEYKDAYLVFKSIPVADYDTLLPEIEKAQKEKKSGTFLLEILKRYFIEGSFPDMDKLTQEDLNGLDQDAVVQCFMMFTGQTLDPKVQSPSSVPLETTASTTE